MGDVPWAENDALFLDELRRGYEWQRYVAAKFAASGVLVTLAPLTVRDHISDAEQWTTDDSDLLCAGRHVEVKSRRLSFTGPADYPYPTAMVDTVTGWDAKRYPPVAVVLVSQQTRGLAVVPASSRGSWEIIERRDRVRGITVRSYACPRARLRTFGELVDWLLG